MRRNSRWFQPHQLQQFESSTTRLRELNRKVLQVLLQTGYRRSAFLENATALVALASLIRSLLDFRSQLLAMAREQRPDTIIIRITGLCKDCPGSRRPSEMHQDQALKLDPGWHAEIDSLLELACRAQDRVLDRCALRGAGQLFTALRLLVQALMREQRQLQELIPPKTPEVKVVDDPNRCGQCGKPIKKDNEEATTLQNLALIEGQI
jgi:hypothetical protein